MVAPGGGGELATSGCEPVAVQVGGEDLRALGQEAPRDGLADAARGAGDQDHPVLELPAMRPPMTALPRR